MPWSHPAARMREYILAMRAIWRAWNDGEKLDFRGDFYQHTLMTPFFAPPPEQVRRAEGVPRRGRRADDRGRGRGRRRHHHPRVHDRAVRQGSDAARDRAGPRQERAGPRRRSRSRGRCSSSPAATRTSSSRRARARSKQIAFYGSTPAYRGVLELHGWGDLQTELNALSKRGEWVQMGDLIDDEILNTFAVVAEPEGVGRRVEAPLRRRRRPVLVLRAVRVRPRALGRGDRRSQARVAAPRSPPRTSASTRPSPRDPAAARSGRAGHHLERAVRQPLRDLRAELRGDVGARLAADDADRRADAREAAVARRCSGPSRRSAPRPPAGT